jgi:hypothetical protein
MDGTELGEFKPLPPSVGVAQGGALVGLARSAMAQYIKARTPAEAQVLGAEAGALAGSPLCAAVTLRKTVAPREAADGPASQGTEESFYVRSVQTGPSLARNVISAALEAMRSPELPDRVTGTFLDSCTVEVEVLGPPLAVGNGPEAPAAGQNQSKYQQYQKELAQFNARLGAAINPGLTGLLLVRGDNRSGERGGARAYVLPSEAYEHSLTAADMALNCRARMDRDARGPMQWSIFLTMHFVGYPDGRIVYLSRGKRLAPPDVIDEKALREGAASVGAFLLRHQARRGDKGDNAYAGVYIIDGAPPTMVDQAHAAYAMTLLARSTGKVEFAASAKAAVAYLAPFVKLGEKAGEHQGAWLNWPGATDREEIAATAWLAMAASTAGLENPQWRQMAAFLQRSLPGNADAETRRRGDAETATTGPATNPGGDGYLGSEEIFIGFYALERLGVAGAGVRSRLEGIEPADLQAAMWKARAGLDRRPVAQIVAGFGGRVLGEDGSLDEVGGVRPRGGYPLTELSAMLALVELEKPGMAGGKVGEGEKGRGGDKDNVGLAARRFCYQMTYRATEAYFEARPGELVGGVRGSPVSAQIRLSACAAAIEAEIGDGR